MTSYGLDFGTTNSALSIRTGDSVKLLPLDTHSKNPEVIRSALYFYPKELIFDDSVTYLQRLTQTYNLSQISFKGSTKTLYGSEAVTKYLSDNTNRQAGVTRTIYTGSTHEVALFTTKSGEQKTDIVKEYFEETDYGTGRLFHSLKTALKSPFFKGVNLYGHFYDLEELISLYVSSLKNQADKLVGESVKSVKVGRPVIFHENKQSDKYAEDRLKEALKLSGFENITFEYEPVAAANCYFEENRAPQTILIFDFGGGTLDTTIVSNQKNSHPEVLAIDGAYIGGDLLNSDILYHKLAPFFGSTATWGDHQMIFPKGIYEDMRDWYSFANLNTSANINFLNGPARFHHSNPEALDRLVHLIKLNLGFDLYNAVETAKKELTNNDSAIITMKNGPIDLQTQITQKEFEELISPRINEIKLAVLRTLESASLEPTEIDRVVTTGGSSLLPIARNMLSDIFGEEKLFTFNTFTSIASGLA